ncbi:MAG: glycosyltransferase family 2 protein [Trueperaceae bacterium]|nr:glycosyltransferase family 2 protein [Trueperaceae bacterium]
MTPPGALLDVLWVVATAFLAVQLATFAVNAVAFPRLDRRPRHGARPPASTPHGGGPDGRRVSLLVPARDEADTLPETLPALLAQGAQETIVVDDRSRDGTADVVRRLQRDHPTLRLVEGAPLPAGWSGKNWACQQAADAAAGDVLVFTDADVTWAPGALAALLAHLEAHRAGLATVWPRQRTVGWLERIAVPQVDLVLLGGLPHPLVGRTPFASLAAANGQVMAWTRDAYARVGGHAALSGEVLEDVRLAQRAKAHGVRLWLGLGGTAIQARMYRTAGAVVDGFAKNVRAAAGSPALLAALVALNGLAYLAVWPLALLDPRFLVPALLGLAFRAGVAAKVGRAPLEAAWQPLAPLALLAVVLRAASWRDGYVWRGRRYGPEVGR